MLDMLAENSFNRYMTWYKGDSRPRHLQGKGAKTGLVRQTLGFLSLDLCN